MIDLIKMNAEELSDISQVPQDATSQTQDAQESKREHYQLLLREVEVVNT